MIKIDSSFKLFEPPSRCLWVEPGVSSFAELQIKELLLSGTLASLEVAGRTFDLSTGNAPSSDDGFRSRGFGWVRKLVPLAPGMALEQQILIANKGSTVALSWRLSGHALSPVQLTATPIFSGHEATSNKGFTFAPRTEGGRLTWQPYQGTAKIVADTNGRFSLPSAAIAGSVAGGQTHIAIPGAFEFDLGRRPAILILYVEPHEKSYTDPLIGGFLAELANPLPQATARDYLVNLAAA